MTDNHHIHVEFIDFGGQHFDRSPVNQQAFGIYAFRAQVVGYAFKFTVVAF